MRGQIEVLTYELEQAQKRQRDLYVDLDARMRKLGGRPGRRPTARRRIAAARGAQRRAAVRGRAALHARRAARLRRRARPVQARRLSGRDHRLHRVRQELPEERARAVRAILDRQRAVRAQGLQGGDRVAAAAAARLSGQPEGARRAAQRRVRAVGVRRQCRGAAHARGADRQVPAVRRRRQGQAAARAALSRRTARGRRCARRRPQLRRGDGLHIAPRRRLSTLTPRRRFPHLRRGWSHWQRAHGRHGLPWQDTRDPYRIWLSEIMLQQTQVATVIPYYERFLASFPTCARWLPRPSTRARALERPGLLPARASSARGRAGRRRAITAASFRRDAAALATLPGIGRSTAAAIAVFSSGARAAILDGNVKRVLARHRGIAGFPGARDGGGEAVAGRRSAAARARRRDLHAGADGPGRDGLHAHQARCAHARWPRTAWRCSEGRVAELPSPRPRKALPQRAIAGAADRARRRDPVRAAARRWASGAGCGACRNCALDDDVRDAVKDALRGAGDAGRSAAADRARLHALHADAASAARARAALAVARRRPGDVWLSPADARGAALPAPIKKLLRSLRALVAAWAALRGVGQRCAAPPRAPTSISARS